MSAQNLTLSSALTIRKNSYRTVYRRPILAFKSQGSLGVFSAVRRIVTVAAYTTEVDDPGHQSCSVIRVRELATQTQALASKSNSHADKMRQVVVVSRASDTMRKIIVLAALAMVVILTAAIIFLAWRCPFTREAVLLRWQAPARQ